MSLLYTVAVVAVASFCVVSTVLWCFGCARAHGDRRPALAVRLWRSQRRVFYGLGLVLFLFLVQRSLSSMDSLAHERPGDATTPWGLHFNCTAAATGAPVSWSDLVTSPPARLILLESGFAYSSLAYSSVIEPLLAALKTGYPDQAIVVCAYDRAGYGWSASPSRASAERTAAVLNAELHDTLADLAVPGGGLVYVGWSYGGLLGVRYALAYPGEVAGLVLVDPTEPRSIVEDASFQAEIRQGVYSLLAMRWLAPVGLARAAVWAGLMPAEAGFCCDDTLPPGPRSAQRAISSGRRIYDTAQAELEAFSAAGADLVDLLAAHPEPQLGSLPIHLVTAAAADGRTASSSATVQARFQSLSSRFSRSLTGSSDHYVPFRSPASVVDGVMQVLGDLDGRG